MAGRYARLSSKNDTQQSYGIRLNIVKAIENFIFQSNFCIKAHNNSLIEHTKTDIETLRTLVLNFMSKNQMTNPCQQTIANKITANRHKNGKKCKNIARATVGEALQRLVKSGFIYKIRRYQLIDTGERNAQGEIIERPENRALGYCLAPNLLARIKDALKKECNFLAPVNLTGKLKKIVFSKSRQIKTYVSGKMETIYKKPQEALEEKKQRILAEGRVFLEKKTDEIINKPAETTIDHTLRRMAQLLKNKRQTTEPVNDG